MKTIRFLIFVMALAGITIYIGACSKNQPFEPTASSTITPGLNTDKYGFNEQSLITPPNGKNFKSKNLSSRITWETQASITNVEVYGSVGALCSIIHGSARAVGAYPGATRATSNVYPFLFKWDDSYQAYIFVTSDYSNEVVDNSQPFDATSSDHWIVFENLAPGRYKIQARATAFFSIGSSKIEETKKFVYIYSEEVEVQ